ncbi:MAG: hypothetical protein PWP23_3267 [Candidatus Sumerlaeota bacterium]|nr:hypothetical protein [Candidatus Sumerlaeota bacterium]
MKDEIGCGRGAAASRAGVLVLAPLLIQTERRLFRGAAGTRLFVNDCIFCNAAERRDILCHARRKEENEQDNARHTMKQSTTRRPQPGDSTTCCRCFFSDGTLPRACQHRMDSLSLVALPPSSAFAPHEPGRRRLHLFSLAFRPGCQRLLLQGMSGAFRETSSAHHPPIPLRVARVLAREDHRGAERASAAQFRGGILGRSRVIVKRESEAVEQGGGVYGIGLVTGKCQSLPLLLSQLPAPS